MKHFKIIVAIVAISSVIVLSCSKPNDPPAEQTKRVKYEITGNFSGKLTVIYNDNVNGNTVLNNISLPWSVEVTYPANIVGIGIGASSSTTGTAGQTAVIKIYVNGTEAKSSTGTATATGVMTIPTLAHVF